VWQHVAGTFDVATQAVRIYVDGVQVVTTQSPAQTQGPVTSIRVSNSPVRIGALQDGTGNVTYSWSGLIDEVDLFDRALSPSEIQAIYSAGSGGKCRCRPQLPINAHVPPAPGKPLVLLTGHAALQKVNTCWASAGAIMMSWHEGRVLTPLDVTAIADAAPLIGYTFTALFDPSNLRQGNGLDVNQWNVFVSRLGLTQKLETGFPPTFPTICDLIDAVRRGPTLVVTNQEGSPPSVHAEVMTDIVGDGTDSGTWISLIDPAIGRRRQVTYAGLKVQINTVRLTGQPWTTWLQF
jgi:hypothetical protein